MATRTWIPAALDILVDAYPSGGASKVRFLLESELNISTTDSAIRKQASRLNLAAPNQKFAHPKGDSWSESEIDWLWKHYPREGAEVAANKLGRSVSSIEMMTSKLGIHYAEPKRFGGLGPIWSPKENEVLERMFCRYGARASRAGLAMVSGHTRGLRNISKQANKIGLARGKRVSSQCSMPEIKGYCLSLRDALVEIRDEHGEVTLDVVSREGVKLTVFEISLFRLHFPFTGLDVLPFLLPERTKRELISLASIYESAPEALDDSRYLGFLMRSEVWAT